METHENTSIRADGIWVKEYHNTWLLALERTENESDDDLYLRWIDLYIDQVTRARIENDQQRINDILCWVIPILIWSLAFLLAAFVDSKESYLEYFW